MAITEKKDCILFNNIKYEWLGQSTVRMTTDDGFVIYTDPVLLDENPPKADLILITHHHVDHCLPEFVASIRDEKTQLAAFHESYIKYCVQDIKGVRTVKIGQTIELSGVKITGTEAYTKRGFHIKGEGCGFLIELKGRKIYFAGDTSITKEMEGLKDIDSAILPICDNTYTIKTEDMIEAVKIIKPKLFIPVHFTPMNEPDPVVKEGMFATKDPRFFTRKEDPKNLLPFFEGTDIQVAILRKLVRLA
ncbi:MAG: MBL fold metallo-hydrolase [Deltaproteobacteria bacterium]|nr:MBL fold metallo-hydrolase [Deltaproteobacteria bacterium]MBI3756137.1 MBL fold metallo-hydrolase [Deltaproteobacteria bacterium]